MKPLIAASTLVLALLGAPSGARADAWKDVGGAYAAYANDGCPKAESVLAKCKRCDEIGPAAYVALLRAFCRERGGDPGASSSYQNLATLYPNTEIAEHALLRVVTLARPQADPHSPQPPTPQDMESMPRFRASPYYPNHLQRARVEGWVLLELDVLADGRVADVHVVESDPPFLFDLAAVNALMRWYYPPHARENVRVRLSFKLER